MRRLGWLLALAGCHDLPDLGVCGNGVIEADHGEACDGDVAGADTCTASCELACQTSAVSDAYVVVGVDPTSDDELYCADPRQACGLDRICRAASGRFGPAGTAAAFDVKFAVAGDFDGDRIDDLIGNSATQIAVRFGSSTGAPFDDGSLQDAPSSESPLAIFDRRPDQIAVDASDMAIGVPTDGLALLSSDTESFNPDLDVTFAVDDAAFAHFVVGDPDAELGDVVMAVARTGVLAVGRIAIPPGLPEPLALAPCGAPGSRLIEVEVAADRRSFVVLGRPITGAGWFACSYRPAGAGFAAPVVTAFAAPPPDSAALADIDGDACAELVVARVAPAPTSQTTVGFVRASGAGCPLDTAVAALAQGTLQGSNQLFAAGSIVASAGGDPERDELVLTTGVFRVSALALELVARPTSDVRPWTAAALVDINGDGVLDVVAGRRDQDDVDVVRGGAAPNVYRADTAALVTATVAGDFDGDSLGDVALVEAAIGDRVSILYGASDGVIGPAIANSRFDGRLALARLGRFSWSSTARGDDGVDDLVVLHSDAMTSVTRGGVLIGDAPRLLTMPRLPAVQTTAIGAVAVGKLDGARLLAAAIRPTTPGASELRVHDLAAGTFSPPIPVAGFEVDTVTSPQLARTAGRPLVAALGRPSLTTTTFGAFDIDGGVCTRTVDGRPFVLRPADVIGGDGRDELVYTSLSLGARNPRQARVFALGPGAPCTIGDELLAGELAGCADVTRAGDAVVALCESPSRQWGVFRISAEGEREPEPFVEVDGIGVQLITGDFDGDGVPDLALGVARGAEINAQFVRQCPAHDVRGCR